MSFRKKIDMILEASKLQKLTKNKIERILNVDGTIYKAYKANEYPKDPNLISELISKLKIRQAWWDSDWEKGNMDVFEKNHTHDQNKPTVPPKSVDININTLEHIAAGLRGDVAARDKEIARLKVEMDGLRSDLSGLRADIAEVRKERDQIKKKYEELLDRTADNVQH